MREDLIPGFHAAIDKSGGDNACWPWKKSLMSRGYGQIWTGTRNGRAHRIAYELAHGVTLSNDQHVMHSCDNRDCCNPAHLSVGSNADNMIDKVRKGRQSKGEGTGMAKLTASQVIEIRTKYANVKRRIPAELFGITEQAVTHIISGNRWKHIL